MAVFFLRSGFPIFSSLVMFYKIINGLAQVPLEAIQLASMDSRFFPKTISACNGLAFAEAPLLALFRSHFLNN